MRPPGAFTRQELILVLTLLIQVENQIELDLMERIFDKLKAVRLTKVANFPANAGLAGLATESILRRMP